LTVNSAGRTSSSGTLSGKFADAKPAIVVAIRLTLAVITVQIV
jgi:hypothetical protein